MSNKPLDRLRHHVTGAIERGEKQAITERKPMRCDQCEMLSINGVACHERGCPNTGARWDGETWIEQATCSVCGYEQDIDSECCTDHEEYH